MIKDDCAPRKRRKEPPSVEEVIGNKWWWCCLSTGEPHVLCLDVDDGRIFHADEPTDNEQGLVPFVPEDWPGEWAPCTPPEW